LLTAPRLNFLLGSFDKLVNAFEGSASRRSGVGHDSSGGLVGRIASTTGSLSCHMR